MGGRVRLEVELAKQSWQHAGEDRVDRCDIVLRVRQCLDSSSHPEIQHLHCEYNSGVLELKGIVPSYYLKQLAQEAIRQICGAEVLLNFTHIVVYQKSGS